MGVHLRVLKQHRESESKVCSSWLNQIDLNSFNEVKWCVNELIDREKIVNQNKFIHYASYSREQKFFSDSTWQVNESYCESLDSSNLVVGQSRLQFFILAGMDEELFYRDMSNDNLLPQKPRSLESLPLFETQGKTKKQRLIKEDDSDVEDDAVDEEQNNNIDEAMSNDDGDEVVDEIQNDSVDEVNLADKPGDTSDSPKPPRKPFNWSNFILHPGNWVLLALIAVGIAFFAPPLVLPALGAIILTGMTLTLALLPRYIMNYWEQLKEDRKEYAQKRYSENEKEYQNMLKEPLKLVAIQKIYMWIFGDDKYQKQGHGWQVFFVGLGFIVFMLALVFSIGFFSGGGALVVAGGAIVASGGGLFGFMGSVFAAISAPFVALTAAAVAAGTTAALSPVVLGLLSGTLFLIAPLNLIANTSKRVIRFFSELRRGDAFESQKEDVLNEDMENAVDLDESKSQEESQKREAKSNAVNLKYEESLFSSDNDKEGSSEASRNPNGNSSSDSDDDAATTEETQVIVPGLGKGQTDST